MIKSKQNFLVSVALCTYNGEQFLAEQLDSLVCQSYENLEIIIVDDCSSDKTTSILTDYFNRYSFIKVYKNELNLGYVKNFEKAIQLCKGQYIALCDQDDIWDLDKIKILVEMIGNNLLIYHDSLFIDCNGISMNKKMSDVLNMYQGDDFKPFIFFNSISGHASLINKDLFKYCLPFPKEIFHDHWLGYTATNLGSIIYLDKCLVKYRQHENSDTNILNLDRKVIKKKHYGKYKIIKYVTNLKIMRDFKFNKDQDFVNKLYQLYQCRLNSYFCLSLVSFMGKYSHSLMYISKKGTFSKKNFLVSNLFGTKFKRK